MSKRAFRCRVGGLSVLLLGLAACSRVGPAASSAVPPQLPGGSLEQRPEEGLAEKIHDFCSRCHQYPPPDVLPRAQWRSELETAYTRATEAGAMQGAPPLTGVLGYYERLAPVELPAVAPET